MRSFSPSVEVERAQPWLGTRVVIRAAAANADAAHAAVSAAFVRVAQLHDRLSFHQPESELSLLNRCAWREPLAVHTDTRNVLELALKIAAASDGVFDPTIAGVLVATGHLPAPVDCPTPDPRSDWRDVHIDAEGRVIFRKPLWLDFGGCAKGFAVDAAVDVLRSAGATQGCVDAGGDLRVFGERAEWVALRDFAPRDGRSAAVQLTDAALAASNSAADAGYSGAQVDALARRPFAVSRAVCVVAPGCAVADALTKVVMADAPAAASLLKAFGARAFVDGQVF